jgi:hypothetical protein
MGELMTLGGGQPRRIFSLPARNQPEGEDLSTRFRRTQPLEGRHAGQLPTTGRKKSTQEHPNYLPSHTYVPSRLRTSLTIIHNLHAFQALREVSNQHEQHVSSKLPRNKMLNDDLWA